MKIKIDYYSQYKDYSCGPVALKMVFDHLGIECTREEMITLCETMPKEGTDTESLIEAVEKQHGLAHAEKDDASVTDITCLLESGYPVIVNYCNPLSSHGHYSVINGYDPEEEILFFSDPANGKDYTLSFEEFDSAWHSGDKLLTKWLLVVGRETITTTDCEVF